MPAAPEFSSAPRMRTDNDIAVVGGGVVGMCLAFGLAQKGLNVTVLDEGDRAFRASRGNFALVWLHTKGLGNPSYSRWSKRSVELWRQFADHLKEVSSIDVGLEQRGGFLLCLSEKEMLGRAGACDRLARELGNDRHPLEIMDHVQLSRFLPALGSDVVGGSFCPLDGHVNALRLFGGLHQACERLGVTYRPNNEVDDIRPAPGGFDISTPNGTISTPKIVLAAGLGNARLAPMVGLSAPVRAERGQIIVTEKLDRFLDYPIGNVRQTDEGGIMIGASKEEAGFNTGTTYPVLADLASDATRMFPILGKARVVRTWSALRVLSPDECPIYDQSTRFPGAFLVTCHSGITLAAVHALDLANQIAAGVLAPELGIFSARRFADVQKTA
ncbi:glycine/D-amino acid oxidase-like deaminating enzyme [Rhizobium aethiopicum]|uniref:NAD(P)/FAD-dependent oxidoreductase n=1 Tax=Rhizobium aethiopicum TaxID=1138170 RepID=UPI00182F1CFF|nr:FAD-dependent oxidoreductase [Rhizobium aethiopicum]MBB4581623.1 glycine/D-amino acid oxidase-like deaminating enzyme [Rhizobium aethiopicum]